MTGNIGASASGPGSSPVGTGAGQAVSALSGNDPSRSDVASIILAKLKPEQRAFILKMKPHPRSQPMSVADFRYVDCCVDSGTDWPDVYWFGGMQRTWNARGRSVATFTFNEVGLEVRASLASGMQLRENSRSEVEAEGLQPVPEATPTPSVSTPPSDRIGS